MMAGPPTGMVHRQSLKAEAPNYNGGGCGGAAWLPSARRQHGKTAAGLLRPAEAGHVP
eukprot:CAMPEP_0204579366 /NCGR_PEP_ID=MMETSP0661-20131031/43451_1 /ASSEMBLY_ACC=CAM_ASM_000606 /TAXON_ID=109239 /ORGANISM="Alexandrium margalefi, Strain AMGDE01CS-322" /LENGTH=57 /DNA_ID=CAMNT_0051588367 /DNA_START=10 /DNA_END=179 /DNA_ORIENTATION=-